jgi:biopolymer transport protein ExbB
MICNRGDIYRHTVTSIAGMCAFTVFKATPAWAQQPLANLVDNVQQAQRGLTVWELLQQGGVIMIVLGVLSILALAIVFYNFLILRPGRLTPRAFAEDVIEKLGSGNDAAAKSLCQRRHNIIANIVMAGLDKKKQGPVLAREAMETTSRQEIGHLWQNISYLSDIASIAPLIGLLGTVLGMIQAFNVIAFQTAVNKPILLAGGVSKAMITTAGGLIVAIPVMLFYSFFRGKVLEIANTVESYSNDIIMIIEDHIDRNI